jgi:hypothetical protein
MFKASLSIVLAALNTLLIAAASPTTTTATKSVQVVAPASTKAPNGTPGGLNDSDTAQTDEATHEPGSLEARVLVDVDPDAPIKPRRINAKVPVRGPGSIETRLSPTTPKSGNVVFKVRDELKARTGMRFGTELTSATTNGQGLRAAPTAGPGTDRDRELDEIRAVLHGHSATIRQCIGMTQAELTALETRARNISRVEQPDLAGIIYARPGAPGMEADLAEALNALPSVEYAEVEYLPGPAQDSCQKDVSLQSGPAAAGTDIEQGTNCISYTDNQGNPADCPTPPPVFIAQRGDGVYRTTAAPIGVVPCHAPDRWNGYITSVKTATGCNTQSPNYTVESAAQPSNFDCTPNCNQGGNGNCSNPPTGYTSVQGCQYGCQDLNCVSIVTGQGFDNCNNPDSTQGWDALCATIANIYCGGPTGYTPYVITGDFLPQGVPGTGWLPDEATQTCYALTQSTLAATWATAKYTFGSTGVGLTGGGSDGDSSSYDPCFVRRGPANPPTIDPTSTGGGPVPTTGIVAYADVGDGSGIRPWAFNFDTAPAAGSQAYANAYLQAIEPVGTFDVPCPIGYNVSVGGLYLWDTNPSEASNAVFAEFNDSLKSYPYYFSHDCTTPSFVTPGCYLTPCCVSVCIQDPSCCTVAWDDACVSLTTNSTNSGVCGATALNPAVFPPSGDTPDFRGQTVPPNTPSATTAQGLQVWNWGLPVATSCSQYVRNYPTAEPGQISLRAITDQTELSATAAMINTGFGGGGIAVDTAAASVSASFPGINTASISGSGLNVGVIDSSCFPDHEALVDAYNNGRLIIEPGQTLVVTPEGTTPLINPDHGTAVLAMLIGQPVNGGGGVNSVLPNATAYFFPSVSETEAGRIPTAISRASQTLQPGDILVIPLAYTGNYSTGTASALSGVQVINTLMGVCFSIGITTFQPAGNGGFEVSLTPSGGSTESTYSVTVGAGWPGAQTAPPTGTTGNLFCQRARTFPGNAYCRYMNSNWTASQGSSANAPGVDVQGWGLGICTAGLGTLFKGDNQPSQLDVYSNPNLTTNRLRTYQYNFGGTSGASAQIACLGGMMQGFARTYFGAPISPARVRQILANQLDPADGTGQGYLYTCILQCQQTVGSALPSTTSDSTLVVKNGDLVVQDGLTPHQVGGFPLATPCLYAVATTTFNPGGTPFNVTIVKGTVRGGGSSNASYAYACARQDNYFLKIQGVRTGRGSTGQAYGPAFPYAANGLVTDIQLRANTLLNSEDDFDNMSFSATGAATNGSAPPGGTANTALTMAYVYNRVSRRWNFLAFGFMSNVQSTPIATNLAATYYPSSNFLVTEGNDKVVYFRVVTYPFGIVGPYQAWWDLFGIVTNSTLPTK